MNSINLIGNLTRDPELRSLESGTSVCKMRLAVNTRRKDSSSGEWVDKPNYFDVTAFGGRGETAAEYLAKGNRVGVSGRLESREWEVDGSKRYGVEILVDQLVFLTPKSPDEGTDGPVPAAVGATDGDGSGEEVSF